MSNATPTVLAQSPADLEPRGTYIGIPKAPRLPSLAIPGTTLVTWRGDQPADLVPTAELDDFLTRQCGPGWEHGADGSGFEDFTVRDDEGDVIAELQHY